MNNSKTAILGIYTLTPLHVGTGQATGAVDLPVAREQHTGLPVIPATSIKGVVRDILEELEKREPPLKKQVDDLLGPDTDNQDGLQAGSLIFTEAQTIALPFRSLNRPFVFATSLLVLEKLARNLRTFGLDVSFPLTNFLKGLNPKRVLVADEPLGGHVMVIEDLIFDKTEVFYTEKVAKIAELLTELLPSEEREEGTGRLLKEGLVILPDKEFLDLANRCLPVQARIKLTSGKTASKWQSPDGDTEKGNLWYEEFVSPDSLFAFFLMRRPGAKNQDPVGDFFNLISKGHVDISKVQLGGNETVGYGWCWWNSILQPEDSHQQGGLT